MTLQLGGDGVITGCTSLQEPDLTVSGLTINGALEAPKAIVSSGTAAEPSYTFSGDIDTGLYYAGTNTIGVSTNGTPAVIVNAVRQVLVGTTSARSDFNNGTASCKVQLEGTNFPSSSISITRNSSGVGAPALELAKTKSTDVGGVAAVVANDKLGTINFSGSDGTDLIRGARIEAHVDGTPGTDDMPGRLVFLTTAAGMASPAERLRINKEGKLLVGITSDFGSGSAGDLIQAASGSGGHLLLGREDSAVSANETMGLIRGYSYAGSVWGEAARISLQADSNHISTSKPGRILFSITPDSATTPTERFRLDNEGRVDHFASDANAYDLHVADSGATDVAFAVKSGATSLDDGTLVMNILADGDIENATGRYTQISDFKFKENIINASSQWEDLKAIRIVNFNFKEEKNWGTHKQIGVVAQEIEAVSPGLVCQRKEENGEEYKSVAYSVLYMKAVKALQEAIERIETLEQRLTDAGL